jgi:hypothetical protein
VYESHVLWRFALTTLVTQVKHHKAWLPPIYFLQQTT